MDERLQQAIAAIKTHDNQTAQQLLAQFLKSNPNHPQGWFLLSQVVADRKQQIAFLNKTLALDPEHRQARQKLSALGEAVPVSETPTLISPSLPVSQDQGDWGAQAEATTIPPWLAGQQTYQAEALSQTSDGASLADFAEPTTTQPAQDIPDWLKEEPAVEEIEEERVQEEPVAAATPTPASTPAPAPKPAPAKKTGQVAEPLPWYFWLLVLFAVLVFIAIIYQAFNL